MAFKKWQECAKIETNQENREKSRISNDIKKSKKIKNLDNKVKCRFLKYLIQLGLMEQRKYLDIKISYNFITDNLSEWHHMLKMISVDENDTDQINNKRKQTHRRNTFWSKEKSSTNALKQKKKSNRNRFFHSIQSKNNKNQPKTRRIRLSFSPAA